MGNTFAYFMLFAWFPITALLFRGRPSYQGVILSLLWGYLLLPQQTGINLPLLPTFDKALVPSLAVLVMLFFRKKSETRTRRREALKAPREDNQRRLRVHIKEKPGTFILSDMIVVALLLSGFATFLANQELLFFGPRVIRGLRLYDAFAMGLNTLVMLLPFWIVRKTIMSEEAIRFFLRAVVAAGLFYSVLALIEIRLSPQLHRWIYGFHSHNFQQHIRGGHFRPMIFVGHGLRVGMFLSIATLSAFILAKIEPDKKKRTIRVLSGLYLFAILYLSRNLGASMITALILPMVVLLSVKRQLMTAALISSVVLLYPILRGLHYVPINSITSAIEAVSPDRAQSLKFRLNNEDILLDRANEKPLTGWGGYDRQRVFDPVSGRDTTIVDGTWIIQIGFSGWIGYIGLFALLCMPSILMFLSRRKFETIDGGLALLLTANLIDLIPNSSLVVTTWVLAGILWSRYVFATIPTKDPGRSRSKARSRTSTSNIRAGSQKTSRKLTV